MEKFYWKADPTKAQLTPQNSSTKHQSDRIFRTSIPCLNQSLYVRLPLKGMHLGGFLPLEQGLEKLTAEAAG